MFNQIKMSETTPKTTRSRLIPHPNNNNSINSNSRKSISIITTNPIYHRMTKQVVRKLNCILTILNEILLQFETRTRISLQKLGICRLSITSVFTTTINTFILIIPSNCNPGTHSRGKIPNTGLVASKHYSSTQNTKKLLSPTARNQNLINAFSLQSLPSAKISKYQILTQFLSPPIPLKNSLILQNSTSLSSVVLSMTKPLLASKNTKIVCISALEISTIFYGIMKMANFISEVGNFQSVAKDKNMGKVFNISLTNTSLKDISQKGNELVLAL